MAEVISVSALNRYVKNLLDVNDVLFDLACGARSPTLYRTPGAGTATFPCGTKPPASGL